MSNAESLRTMDDYERALKEVAPYFDNPPEPGTVAGDRFKVLIALVVEFENIHFPIPS